METFSFYYFTTLFILFLSLLVSFPFLYTSIFERKQLNLTIDILNHLKSNDFNIEKFSFENDFVYKIELFGGEIIYWGEREIWSFHRNGCEVCGFMNNWLTGLYGHYQYISVKKIIEKKIEEMA